jgi:hypothetical protein
MSILKKLLAVVFLFPTVALAAETIAQPIKHYRFDAVGNNLYVVGPNLWGAAACNAIYVTFKPSLAWHKQMFAAVLSAHASSKTVKFYGECGTDPNYFDATYIVVE